MYFPYAYDVLYATFLVSGSVLLYGVYTHLQRYGIGMLDVLRASLKDIRVKLSRFVKISGHAVPTRIDIENHKLRYRVGVDVSEVELDVPLDPALFAE